MTNLKPGWHPPQARENRPDLDSSRCRADKQANGVWVARHPLREPHLDQLISIKTSKELRTYPDKIMLYCLRPPEMWSFTLDQYFSSVTFDAYDEHALSQEFVINWKVNGLFDLRRVKVRLRKTVLSYLDPVLEMFKRLGAHSDAPVF